MALTRDFKETIRARVERDPKFRKELLREGIECMLTGDIATAKTTLRDYINATVGFTELAEATHIPSKSLMRMLGPTGNPRADNLFVVVSFLQRREGVSFQLKAATRYRTPQWILDSWSRRPDKDDVLFLTPEQWKATPKVEQGPWPANACLHMDSDSKGRAYALGYHRAAQLLADHAVRERGDQDLLIYPILFSYRHAVELFLKRIIPVAANLVDQPLSEDEGRHLAERATHRIKTLWVIFKPRLERMGTNRLCEISKDLVEGIESYIRQLSEVDEQSFSFRYAASKDGTPTLSDFRYINIMRIAVLLEPFVGFFEGLDELIHEQYQAKCEYMLEAQAHNDGSYDYD
jgi:DNA-binding phage protein